MRFFELLVEQIKSQWNDFTGSFFHHPVTHDFVGILLVVYAAFMWLDIGSNQQNQESSFLPLTTGYVGRTQF